jgi:ribose transport system permease protein
MADTAEAVPRGNRRGIRTASADDLVVGLLPYALLAILVLWLAYLQPASLTGAYVQNIIGLSFVPVLIAFGQGVVMVGGGIDLSVPGVLSVVNVLAATQMTTPARAAVVGILLLLFGWLPGLINGLLVTKARMQPFIVTLAMWFIWAGLAFYILPGPGGEVDATIAGLVLGKYLGLAGTTWLLILLVAAAVWFGRTRLGLSIRAVGSDPVSARHSGVAVAEAQLASYAISSWFATAAGLILSLQSLSGEPTAGNSYVLPMITAVVVGGVSLMGGRGSLTGPIVGAIVLAYLTGVTFSFRLQPQWNQILQGFLLVGSISSTYFLQYLVKLYREESAR